jgi:hypothetical protein
VEVQYMAVFASAFHDGRGNNRRVAAHFVVVLRGDGAVLRWLRAAAAAMGEGWW